MIARDFLDSAVPDLVQTSVADVSDHGRIVMNDGNGEHTSHAGPCGTQRGEAIDFVVGGSDGFTNPFGDRARLTLEPRAEDRDRRIRSLSTRGLSAHAVHDEEDPTVKIHVITVFVDLTVLAWVRGAGGPERARDSHAVLLRRASASVPTRTRR